MFLLLFVFLLSSVSGTSLCPSPEDILPCYCVSDGSNIRIDCLQVSDVDEVRKSLQSLRGRKNVFIDFVRARLKKVPSDLFKGLDVTKLSFTNSHLQEIGEPGKCALEGLEDIIEDFSVHFSFQDKDHPLKFLNISNLRKLEDFEIEGNEMSELSNDWFRDGPESIRNLFVMTNLLQSIGDQAFRSLKNLRNLWVTGNSLKSWKRSMLPDPAPFLRSLDLSNNEIIFLSHDLFENMPSLKEVVLTGNSIRSIDEATWSSIWSRLTSLYLDDNPLVCNTSTISWMVRSARRPHVLKATCVEPTEVARKQLKHILDDEIISGK